MTESIAPVPVAAADAIRDALVESRDNPLPFHAGRYPTAVD